MLGDCIAISQESEMPGLGLGSGWNPKWHPRVRYRDLYKHGMLDAISMFLRFLNTLRHPDVSCGLQHPETHTCFTCYRSYSHGH